MLMWKQTGAEEDVGRGYGGSAPSRARPQGGGLCMGFGMVLSWLCDSRPRPSWQRLRLKTSRQCAPLLKSHKMPCVPTILARTAANGSQSQ